MRAAEVTAESPEPSGSPPGAWCVASQSPDRRCARRHGIQLLVAARSPLQPRCVTASSSTSSRSTPRSHLGGMAARNCSRSVKLVLRRRGVFDRNRRIAVARLRRGWQSDQPGGRRRTWAISTNQRPSEGEGWTLRHHGKKPGVSGDNSARRHSPEPHSATACKRRSTRLRSSGAAVRRPTCSG